jgi:hypothetical protein
MKYTEMELDDILDRKFNAGLKYAEISAIYQRYDKGHDQFMRKIMSDIRQQPMLPGTRTWSHENLKDIALASEEWSEFLDDYNTAYENMLKALAERDHWATVFEAKRSQLSYEKAFAK